MAYSDTSQCKVTIVAITAYSSVQVLHAFVPFEMSLTSGHGVCDI